MRRASQISLIPLLASGLIASALAAEPFERIFAGEDAMRLGLLPDSTLTAPAASRAPEIPLTDHWDAGLFWTGSENLPAHPANPILDTPPHLPVLSIGLDGLSALAPADPAAAIPPPDVHALGGAIQSLSQPSAGDVAIPVILIGGTLLVVMTATLTLLFQRREGDLITTAVSEVHALILRVPSSRSAKSEIASLTKILRRIIASNEAPDEQLVPLHDLLKRCEASRYAPTPITESTLLRLAERSLALLKTAQRSTSRRST
jgi:hypothetical protein